MNQREKNIQQCRKAELNSSNELSSPATAPKILSWISPEVTFWSNFSLYKYVQGKSNSPESAPGRKYLKLK